MSADELMAKMDAILSLAGKLHDETVELRATVEVLKTEVDRLNERVAYREKTLTGWKEIAAYLGYSTISVAKELASESFDPLPVWRSGGGVVSLATALDAYKRRREVTRKAVRFVPRETGEDPS